MKHEGLVASVRQRLLNLAKERSEPFDYVLGCYGIERFLYRLSVSALADQFVLKGAMLFRVWNDAAHRPTRDLDLLGFIAAETETVSSAVLEVVRTSVPDDGLLFDEASLTSELIRETTAYGGIRSKMNILLGRVRIPLQLDIGFGDAVSPSAEMREFPALLPDFPSPKLSIYPVYTVIAEKLEALVTLDAQNSRMKDFFDLRTLLKSGDIDREQLITAVHMTFARRKTQLPALIPTGLTAAFAKEKETMWRAFLRKNSLMEKVGPLGEVIEQIVSSLPFGWKSSP